MAKNQRPFMTGDLVTHAHRGDGVFECYRHGRSSCFVKLKDSGQSEEVTTSLISHRVLVPEAPKCKHCKKAKGDHKAQTLSCPIGRRSGIGYTHFSETQFFTPKV